MGENVSNSARKPSRHAEEKQERRFMMGNEGEGANVRVPHAARPESATFARAMQEICS